MILRPLSHLARAVDGCNLDMITEVCNPVVWAQWQRVFAMDCVLSGQWYLGNDGPGPALPVPLVQHDILHYGVQGQGDPGQGVGIVGGGNTGSPWRDLWCSRSSFKSSRLTMTLAWLWWDLTCEVDDGLCGGDTVGGHTLVLTKIVVAGGDIPEEQGQLDWGQLGDGEVGLAGQSESGHSVPHHVDGRHRGHTAHQTHLQSGPCHAPQLLDADNWRIGWNGFKLTDNSFVPGIN